MLIDKQFVTSEFCLECKGCCCFADQIWQPLMLEQDKQEIGAAEIPLLAKDGVSICGFLKQPGYLCSIYCRRPLECRLYPFLLNRRGQKLELAVHLACPYIMKMQGSPEYDSYAAFLAGVLAGHKISPELKIEFKKFRSYPDDEIAVVRENILTNEE